MQNSVLQNAVKIISKNSYFIFSVEQVIVGQSRSLPYQLDITQSVTVDLALLTGKIQAVTEEICFFDQIKFSQKILKLSITHKFS